MRTIKVLIMMVFVLSVAACASTDSAPMKTAQNQCEAVGYSGDFTKANRSDAMSMCTAVPSCRYIAPLSCVCPKDDACVCAGSDAKCTPI